VTTGATAAESVRILQTAGSCVVGVLAIAHAWRRGRFHRHQRKWRTGNGSAKWVARDGEQVLPSGPSTWTLTAAASTSGAPLTDSG